MSDRYEEGRSPTGTFLFLDALRSVLGRAPIWIVTTSILLLLVIPVALPWHAWFGEVSAHRYAPGELVQSLDQDFRFDHRAELDLLRTSTAKVGAGLALLAALLGVFAAGGWLQVILERSHGHSLRRFFFGGSRYFWRFFRFWILTLVVLAGVHWVLYEWPYRVVLLQWILEVPEHAVESLETFESERSVRLLGWARDGLAAIGFALVMAWGVFSRTRLALHDTSSALWSGICSFFMILRHPLKTLRPLLALFSIEFIVVVILAGAATRWFDARLDEGWTQVLMLFVVGQAALLWREVTRGARYYAAVEVSLEVVRPLSRPDPWKAIGGPGGPQYPVDGGDEYGVAL